MPQVRNSATGQALTVPDDAVLSDQWKPVTQTPASPTAIAPLVQAPAPMTQPAREIPGVGTLTMVPKSITPVVPPAQVQAPGAVMERAGIPAMPAATPPAGATLVSDPSGLAGLSESQIWRDPSSNRIYRLAAAPVASPTSPAITSIANANSVADGYRKNFFRSPTQAELDFWSTQPQSEFDSFMASEVQKYKPTQPEAKNEYPSPDYPGLVTSGETERLTALFNAYDTQLKSLEEMIRQGYTPTPEEKAMAAEFQAKREELRAFDLATLQRTEVMEGTGRGRTVANVQLAQDKERRMRALERLGLAQEAETLSERLTGAKDERKGIVEMASSFFSLASSRFDAALGLSKEIARIAKDERDNARTYLLDVVDWAQGMAWEDLDQESQQRITENMANSPLTLGMVKQALSVGKNKLAESDMLTVDESIKLGVPFGTTRSQAAAMGLTVTGGGEDMNKLLSPTEAAQLGVPYGTTVGQAAALGISPSGGLTTAQAQTLESVTTKYQGDAIVKMANDATVTSNIADMVITNPSGGPEQIAALYSFIKTLDPTSAVREGEIALATETQSYLSTWVTEIKKLAEGKSLDPSTVLKLAQSTKKIAQQWKDVGTRRTNQYRAQAEVLGIGQQFDSYLSLFSSSVSGPQNEEEQKFLEQGAGGSGSGPDMDTWQRAQAAGVPYYLFESVATSPGMTPEKFDEWLEARERQASGEKEQRSGGSVSWRNSNPLNIKMGSFAAGYGATQGTKATDGGYFATFPSEEKGIEAARDLLKAPGYANRSLEYAMKRWSGGLNPDGTINPNKGYGADVAPPELRGKQISQMTDQEIDALVAAMMIREGYLVGTYSFTNS